METKVLGFWAIAAVLGIISAAAGFAAEVTRVKESEVNIQDDDMCVYPSSPAFMLGIAAVVLTIIAQIYVTVIIGGVRCCRNDPNSTLLSRILFKFSGVASLGAVIVLLLAGGLKNKQSGQGERVDLYHVKCDVVKPGFYAVGAIFSLLSSALGVAAYIILTHPRETITNPADALPVGANVDPERSPAHFPLSQHDFTTSRESPGKSRSH